MMPNPATLFPLQGYERLCFLKNLVTHPKIEVGDFTYYDDFEDVHNFEKNVRYLFEFTGDRLVIGKYCMIASGVEFILNGGNHLSESLSAFPFAIFGGEWSHAMDGKTYPVKGDIRIGNDVWLGYQSMVMPGVTIGNGAIIGTRAVVTKDVPAYGIVAGNPAKLIRMRFNPFDVAALQELRWWDWPQDVLAGAVHLLTGNDLPALKAYAMAHGMPLQG